MSNIGIYLNHVKEHAPDQLPKEWVVWMLGELEKMEGKRLNPEYVALSHNVTGVPGGFGTTEINGHVFHHEPYWSVGQKIGRAQC